MMFRAQALACVLLLLATHSAVAQTKPVSERAAATAMTALWRDPAKNESGYPAKWTYDHGLVLKGIERVYQNTRDKQYLDFIQRSMDHFVADDGSIRTYSVEEYNIDHILPGRNLLFLYKVTKQEKYRKAAELLRSQLKTHPRTSEGGFWHKKIYPSQMWLDGLYMAEPFYAEYALTFDEKPAFDDIAKQFTLMERHARDDKTGLLYHGWDESRKQRWANPDTGRSPNFWGRAMGWYAMALVDTLDHFPDHPQVPEMIAILNRLAQAVAKYQDPRTGLWYQVLDKGTEKGNYLESSAACMFVYALTKGARNGYLASKYLQVAEKGYRGILKEFVKTDASGRLNLEGTVSVAGLGGNPYRDGSYEYYLSEKVVTNDPKGIGALILAATEIEAVAKWRKKGKLSTSHKMSESNANIFKAIDAGRGGTTFQEVVSQLREMIHRGELRPGDRLPPERDLAKLLGVSRPTLRAGISSLAAVGVLQPRRGAGTFVVETEGPPALDSNALRLMASLQRFTPAEMFEARRSLEMAIAALAAERATGEQMAEMSEEITGMFASLDEPEQFLVHDMRFHQTVAAASGNRILTALMNMVATILFEVRSKTVKRARDLKESAEMHRTIYRAIRERDPEAARNAMRDHLMLAQKAQEQEEEFE